jgi:hypothetical protein
LLSPLIAEFLSYCLCVLSNAHLCEIAPLLRTPSTAHTVLSSLACTGCFGELLWDAAFAGNFGEQFWGRIYIWIIPNYIFKYPNI